MPDGYGLPPRFPFQICPKFPRTLNTDYVVQIQLDVLLDIILPYKSGISFRILIPVSRSSLLHESERTAIEQEVPEVGYQPLNLLISILQGLQNIGFICILECFSILIKNPVSPITSCEKYFHSFVNRIIVRFFGSGDPAPERL